MHKTDHSKVSQEIIREKKPYIPALIFLVVVIIATIGGFVYNNILKEDISTLSSNIEITQKKTADMKESSSLLQASALFEKNKMVLAKLQERSHISKYIKHVSSISRKYKIDFSGFDYSGDSIYLTVLSATKKDGALAYSKTVKFLSEYSADEKNLFETGYISSMAGHDSIKFGLDFDIK